MAEATACLTCAESTDRHSLVSVGENEDAQNALAKHFWFTEDEYHQGVLCPTCWCKIDDFHQFYREVERVHSSRKCLPINLLEVKQEKDGQPLASEFETTFDDEDKDEPMPVKKEEEGEDYYVECMDQDNDGFDEDISDADDPTFKDGKEEEASSDNDDGEEDDDDDPEFRRPRSKPGRKPKYGEEEMAQINEYISKNLTLECDTCSAQLDTFDNLQKHSLARHEKQSYVTCCKLKTCKKAQLYDHVQFHLKPNSFVCEHCSKTCISREALRKHISKVHTTDADRPFQCDICSKRFVKKGAMILHKSIHSEEDAAKYKAKRQTGIRSRDRDRETDKLIAENITLECDTCQKKFTTFVRLQNHSMAEHQKAAYVFCCDSKFNTKSRLTDHIQYHLDPTQFQCKICSKQLPHSESLKRHMDHKHSEPVATLKCSQCPKTFSHLKFLNMHEKYHRLSSEKTWHCEPCDKYYAYESMLKHHQRSVHDKSFKFVCFICAKGFQLLCSYNAHVAAHDDTAKKVEPKERMQCSECGAWVNKKGFNKHMMVHSSTRTCELCGQECKNIMAYKYHMAQHKKGEFYCSVCGKAFKRELTLKEHMASHTGEALYKCDFCYKTFNSNANCASHRKKMHPQEWLEDRNRKRASRGLFDGPAPSQLIADSSTSMQ